MSDRRPLRLAFVAPAVFPASGNREGPVQDDVAVVGIGFV